MTKVPDFYELDVGHVTTAHEGNNMHILLVFPYHFPFLFVRNFEFLFRAIILKLMISVIVPLFYVLVYLNGIETDNVQCGSVQDVFWSNNSMGFSVNG